MPPTLSSIEVEAGPNEMRILFASHLMLPFAMPGMLLTRLRSLGMSFAEIIYPVYDTVFLISRFRAGEGTRVLCALMRR